ncbi:MAG: hypothetical protein HOV80_13690 [Polyangiaceae bacterium]|nr:hypothetical protein [Polyangiaceae bacterium]
MFEDSPLLLLPLAALVMFLGVFVITVIRTYSVRAGAYDDRAALALDEEEKES